MYHWTEDMIRFMKDASAYGTYHRQLASILQPYFSGSRHVCDAGCGLGDLSLELAGAIPEITSIDIKPQAVEVLREHCTQRKITNIHAITGDIRTWKPDKPYDGMIFCFFGKSEEILEIAHSQCRGPVAVVKKDYNTHRFSVGNYPTGPDGFSRMQLILSERKIPFEQQRAVIEFGQPFRCFEDIRKFYLCYMRDEDPSVLTDEFLKNKVIETGRNDFPLYMPHQRKLGIITFRTDKDL